MTTQPLTATAPTNAGTGTMANAAIAYAVQQVGKPYVFGASGPDSFDCSGLVYAAYKSAGYNWHGVRPWTGTLINYGVGISEASLAPGDLVFPDPGHVQLYLGGGRIVEALDPQQGIKIDNMWGFWRARRLVAPGTPYTGGTANASFMNGLNPLAPFTAISSFAGTLANSQTWTRVGYFGAGATLIGLGITRLL